LRFNWITLFVALLCSALAVTPLEARKRVSAKRPAAASSKKAAKAPPARSGKAVRVARGRRGSPKAARQVAARPTVYRQQSPSQERYREIQQALAAKGYYTGPVDGVWNESSIDALRRFQADQNLKGNGKLDSRSLIALGLGPKRETTSQLNLPVPQTQPEQP
jgi:peptidoglycan hydrolase-like protein with peptidoglycan-binding domain